MSDENSTQLLVEHLRQHDANHRDLVNRIDKIHDKQIEQGKTLLRNTITVEEHVKGSIATNKRLTHVENQLFDIQKHVSKVQWVWNILIPTRKKIAILLTLLSLLTGGSIGVDLASKEPKVKKILKLLSE